MSDSFFTARNQVDPQVAHAPPHFCDELIDASTRRLAKVEGPLEASKRLQRVADICAGAYVLPMEHWKDIEARAKPEPADEPKKRGRLVTIWRVIVENPAVVFWTGFFAGAWFGGLAG